MLGLAAAVAQEATMRAYLDQPELDSETQAKALADVCGDELNESARNFIAQLADNKRLALLPTICLLSHELLAEAHRLLDVELTPPFQLD